jgi:hypothetical protein
MENRILMDVDQDLRGGSSNRAFHPVHGRIACGSMVLLLSFSHKFCTECKICVKKKRILRPAGGEAGRLFRHMPGLEPTA